MKRKYAATGDRFGRWTVESLSTDPLKADCVCDCGTRKSVNICNMKRGLATSCGCFRNERIRKTITTHGLTRTPEYISWVGMIQRCCNPKYPGYRDYGGRGIGVDESWMKFEAFLEDMGFKPGKEHSIDRIDNSLGYCKSNCRWATRIEQSRNKRTTRVVVFNGNKMSVADAAEQSGVPYNLLRGRLLKGWDFDRAISTPARKPLSLEARP